MLVDLADPAQRLGEDPPLRFELFVEPEGRPVAATAVVRDRAGRGAAEGARLDEAHQFGPGEALLYFEEPHQRFVTGENVDREDRKTVDARERRATGDKLNRLNG